MCTQSNTHTHTHKLDNGVQVGKAAVTAGCCLGVVSAGAIVRTLAPPLIIRDEYGKREEVTKWKVLFRCLFLAN